MENLTMNISEKTSKKGLLDFITNAVEKVTALNKNLGDRLTYAVNMATKDLKKVTKEDLIELAQEAVAVLTTPPVAELTPVENSIKPKLGKAKSNIVPMVKVDEDESGEADVEAKEPEEEVKAPEKETTKKPKLTKGKGKTAENATVKVETPKVEKPVQEKVKTDKATSIKTIAQARMFPLTIDHKDLGKLVSQHDKYHTIEEVREAITEGKTLYFASYWTQRHIKQFDYAGANQVAVPKTGFPLDLDILLAVIACEKVNRIWCMSSYTEALFSFNNDEFLPIEDKDDQGKPYTIRVSGGMEYEIYAPADEVK